MSDIFKDMQANVGCDYISNLPSYKRKVWHEMKRLPLTNYDIKQKKCIKLLKRGAEGWFSKS